MSDMLPRPEPRDAFKRALRSQLVAAASARLVRRETSWSRFQRSFLRPALALGVVVLLLIGAAGKAAADSLPGDVAYPLKRVAEEVQLAFAIDETTRLRLLAQQADHRLAELAASIESQRPTTPLAQREYAAAVTELTKQVDAVVAQPGVSTVRKIAAEDIVDAAHLKHSAVLDKLVQQGASNPVETQNIQRAKDESEKLHASGKPARTAEPSDQPGATHTPQPDKTASPSHTPDAEQTGQPSETPGPTHTAEPSQTPEPTHTAKPSRSPEPTRTAEHSRTPRPSQSPERP